VDVSDHEDYRGGPQDQTLRLRSIAADLSVDVFMLLDVSVPETVETGGYDDSVFVSRNTELDVTGRFYTSGGTLMGSIRERRYSGAFTGAASTDVERMAREGVREVIRRSLEDIFPFEFSFSAGEGPLYSIPLGTSGGLSKGMVFSVVARSEGIPRSSQEYLALRSHGIMQIVDSQARESTGRLLSGELVDGATLTAVENPAPAVLALSYALLPTEVVPGDGLTGEEAETSRLVSQAEFSGATGKWGLSLGGALFSGVIPRMSSIGIRGEMGTRLPLSSPSLALRLGVGFEAAFLTQNTRADSISSSANTATISGTGTLNLEWMFSGRFGLQTGCTGRIGTAADSCSAGLTYMIY
jgi:hypothetical protein